MKGGQIVALVFAILLLLPGGCFLLVGFALSSGQYKDVSVSELLLAIAAAILALAGLLFWLAFRRRAARGGSPDT
jgi:chromate transport protein ChrA